MTLRLAKFGRRTRSLIRMQTPTNLGIDSLYPNAWQFQFAARYIVLDPPTSSITKLTKHQERTVPRNSTASEQDLRILPPFSQDKVLRILVIYSSRISCSFLIFQIGSSSLFPPGLPGQSGHGYHGYKVIIPRLYLALESFPKCHSPAW